MPLSIADATLRKISQTTVSYYETEAGFPPALAVIDLARALNRATDELLGDRPPRVDIRPIKSLVAVGSSRRNGEQGECHVR
jgi:hypothetical protein